MALYDMHGGSKVLLGQEQYALYWPVSTSGYFPGTQSPFNQRNQNLNLVPALEMVLPAGPGNTGEGFARKNVTDW